MSPDQQHRCTVQLKADGAPYLAFEPSTGASLSYANSLFTLDLRFGVTARQARELCNQINDAVYGVSATVI